MSRGSASWVVWAVLVGVAAAYEVFALVRRDDAHEPLTYYIREVFQLNNYRGPLFWILVGLWLWLGFHFFVDRNH